MQALKIREKLHNYIDKGDERLLKLMYAIAREYNDDDDFEYEVTAEDLQLFKQRRTARLNGESTVYNWKEVKDMILVKTTRNELYSFCTVRSY